MIAGQNTYYDNDFPTQVKSRTATKNKKYLDTEKLANIALNVWSSWKMRTKEENSRSHLVFLKVTFTVRII